MADNVNLKVIGKRVLVRPQERVQSKSGIVVQANTASYSYHKGTILAVGDITQDIKAGDTVYYVREGGLTLDNHGFIIQEDAVLGVDTTPSV